MSVIRVKSRIVLALMLAVAPLLLSGCVLDEIIGGIANEPPYAVIEASPSEGAAPLDVSFDARDSRDDGTIVDYRWSFDDPVNTQSAQDSTATHTFSRPGTYLVRLTVIDDAGETSSRQIAIVVTDAPPIAQASVDEDAPDPGEAVLFSAAESYAPHGAIVAYHWEFGDGTTGTGQTIQHTYMAGGDYIATLTVTSGSGKMTQARLNINVQLGQSNSSCGDGSTSCGGTRVPPVAAITSECFASCAGNGVVGETIVLDGSASRAAAGAIVSYHWDFGDGTTGSGVTVAHAYDKAWSYTVKLTVTDEGGLASTARVPVSIGTASCG